MGILVILVLTICIVGGVHHILNNSIERNITLNAEREAQGWATYFVNHTDNLEGLVSSGQMEDVEFEYIRSLADIGNVFRFKIFNPEGRVIFVSDETRFETETDERENQSDSGSRVSDRLKQSFSKRW